MTDYRDSIDEIIDWFDFERVRRVMAFMEWEWHDSGGVPEIPELRRHARRLLNQAAEGLLRDNQSDDSRFAVSCGGFTAVANRYEDTDKIYLRLTFAIAEWDNYE